MAAVFNWANYCTGYPPNTTTSFTVGSTNAALTNGSIASGDILFTAICVLCGSDPGTITVTGFTPLYDTWDSFSTQRYYVGWKLAGGSESGNYAASWSATSTGATWMLFDIGGASATPIDTSSQSINQVFTTDMLAASCSPTGSTDLLIGIFMGQGNNPYTIDAALTLRADLNSSSSNEPELLMGTQQLSSSGATGTRTSEMTTFGGPSAGYLIAITPSGGGPTYDPTQMMLAA